MVFPTAVVGPWLCLLLFLGVPFTLGDYIAGGLTSLPVMDPEVQQAAEEAVAAYNQRSKSIYYCRVVQVLTAYKQVVSGLMLHLTMTLEMTLCKKSDKPVDLKKCPLPPPPMQKKEKCKFQIWSQAWENKKEISQSCEPIDH